MSESEVAQSCPTFCDPVDCSLLGSSIHGFSRQEYWSGLPFPSPMHEREKWKWKWSRVRLLATPWTAAYQAPPSMDFPGKSTGVGCHCLLQPPLWVAYKLKSSTKRFIYSFLEVKIGQKWKERHICMVLYHDFLMCSIELVTYSYIISCF